MLNEDRIFFIYVVVLLISYNFSDFYGYFKMGSTVPGSQSPSSSVPLDSVNLGIPFHPSTVSFSGSSICSSNSLFYDDPLLVLCPAHVKCRVPCRLYQGERRSFNRVRKTILLPTILFYEALNNNINLLLSSTYRHKGRGEVPGA